MRVRAPRSLRPSERTQEQLEASRTPIPAVSPSSRLAAAAGRQSGRARLFLFALTAFHAALVFGLTGLPGIARRAGAPLVATLLAAISGLSPRKLRRAQANDKDDH